jgi:hypothetical protein
VVGFLTKAQLLVLPDHHLPRYFPKPFPRDHDLSYFPTALAARISSTPTLFKNPFPVFA